MKNDIGKKLVKLKVVYMYIKRPTKETCPQTCGKI